MNFADKIRGERHNSSVIKANSKTDLFILAPLRICSKLFTCNSLHKQLKFGLSRSRMGGCYSSEQLTSRDHFGGGHSDSLQGSVVGFRNNLSSAFKVQERKSGASAYSKFFCWCRLVLCKEWIGKRGLIFSRSSRVASGTPTYDYSGLPERL